MGGRIRVFKIPRESRSFQDAIDLQLDRVFSLMWDPVVRPPRLWVVTVPANWAGLSEKPGRYRFESWYEAQLFARSLCWFRDGEQSEAVVSGGA